MDLHTRNRSGIMETNSHVLSQRREFETSGSRLESHTRAERIIETATDAFIGFDLDGCIVDWNTQATAVFGWSREAAMGRSLWATILTQHCYEDHCRGNISF